MKNLGFNFSEDFYSEFIKEYMIHSGFRLVDDFVSNYDSIYLNVTGLRGCRVDSKEFCYSTVLEDKFTDVYNVEDSEGCYNALMAIDRACDYCNQSQFELALSSAKKRLGFTILHKPISTTVISERKYVIIPLPNTNNEWIKNAYEWALAFIKENPQCYINYNTNGCDSFKFDEYIYISWRDK